MIKNDGKKTKVFLSGSMRGISRDRAISWRQRAIKLLAPECTVITPYQGREEKETLPNYKLAVIRDLKHILESDVLLVNDSFENGSMIGTAMEIFYAFENKKIIIIFGQRHKNNYFMNFHSHVRLNTMEEAVMLIKSHFLI